MFRHGIFFDRHDLTTRASMCRCSCAGRAHPGQDWVEQLLTHVNLAPTMLEAAGAPSPGDGGRERARPADGDSDRTLHEFLVTQECTWQMKWAIRTDAWKYIKAREEDLYGSPMAELYDLDADPGEFHNVAAKRPDVASQLDTKLEGWVSYMMRRNGLDEDPLVTHGITLGRDWLAWGEKHGYW